MSDEITGPKYPEQNLPVIFADNVISMANTPTTVKFYLSRSNPDIFGSGASSTVPIAQIVFPMEGFVAAALFFNKALDKFTRQGLISEAQLSSMRIALSEESSNS